MAFFFLENLGKPVPERQNHSGFNEERDDVASAGTYANYLQFAPDK